ncbi:MAG: hypothetical protein GY751_08125 [Bacteroidetes bacterium]|nr:hypothetical protein [Bacteroidota bacterium]
MKERRGVQRLYGLVSSGDSAGVNTAEGTARRAPTRTEFPSGNNTWLKQIYFLKRFPGMLPGVNTSEGKAPINSNSAGVLVL